MNSFLYRQRVKVSNLDTFYHSVIIINKLQKIKVSKKIVYKIKVSIFLIWLSSFLSLMRRTTTDKRH